MVGALEAVLFVLFGCKAPGSKDGGAELCFVAGGCAGVCGGGGSGGRSRAGAVAARRAGAVVQWRQGLHHSAGAGAGTQADQAPHAAQASQFSST